ncbi:MAG: DMT family transporter, partial [Muribaculaceae bacterium]|nr:DMT family transporter [Muribaculaceae bacterium]
MKIKGYLFAAVAAATYGTNPAFAIPLYCDGMNANTVLLFRYLLGLPFLLLMHMYRRRSLIVTSHQLIHMAILGVLMALSSLTLFESYNYLNAGVASTMLFVYPILVAVLMIMFFHERFSILTILCLIIMCSGLILLMKTDGQCTISGFGFTLVMLSALTYAIYLVMIQVSSKVRNIPTITLTFYVLMFGSSVFFTIIAFGTPLTLPAHWTNWINLLALAILPTVVSLICTSAAIQCIGSTPTAIFGALEPVTAVILSIIVLGQSITYNEITGALLIILATTLVIAGDNIQSVL